uniref:Uncharacterized protein n=1 Tax=Oryctolagus cuniculus TaxID=9986 RepID=A0A5F9D3S7_RABIT
MAACWGGLGTRPTQTVRLLRVPCSASTRMGPTAPSPSPWLCSEAQSTTFPSAAWMVGAIMPWPSRAPVSLHSSSPPWWPRSSTTSSAPCPLWTGTVAAGGSLACSSPPSPEGQVHIHLCSWDSKRYPFTFSWGRGWGALHMVHFQ